MALLGWWGDPGADGAGSAAVGVVRRADVGAGIAAGRAADKRRVVPAWAAHGWGAEVDAADGRTPWGRSPAVAVVRVVVDVGLRAGAGQHCPVGDGHDRPGRVRGR